MSMTAMSMTAMSMTAPWASDWLEGTIRHRRLEPVAHRFSYGTGMLALDVSEWHRLPQLSLWLSLERFNWVSLYRNDYFKPGQRPLYMEIADWVSAQTGWRPTGPIQLITHPRYLGHLFNPVSFYFCYPSDAEPRTGAVPRVILAHITNTPWQERHLYCLECATPEAGPTGWRTVQFQFCKRFHVSPFNPMAQEYHWVFSFRGPELRIHMNIRDGHKVFDATLEVRRTPLCRPIFLRSLRRFPVECAKVVAGIYWQALRLKLKGAPFHPHPRTLPDTSPQDHQGEFDQGTLLADSTPPSSQSGRVRSWRM
ncbi:DUF1365 domain-containing protein [Marinobacter sp. SS21]|uniref:DUF1365 domain-containing protein n=1 Tax=Marinobacter sp. SS21 TaxID=2979460 RepID=UPI00232F3C70|nr:DUF1365 domain-containing protein [Marinobacter sp. SS21]MDC0661816.1 DUF1365 domain-containing protein [Marinobacter sp. SS21]